MSIEIFDETKSVLHIHAKEKFKVIKVQLITMNPSFYLTFGLAPGLRFILKS